METGEFARFWKAFLRMSASLTRPCKRSSIAFRPNFRFRG
jgi:hypothetical protein